MNTSDKVPYRPFWAGSSLTFDNFVVGTANQLAVAEAKKVADHSNLSSNPLFIYGDDGLGKTHLLQAIANQIRIDRPHEKVCFLHAERFVSDVVRAYQTNKFQDFKDFYHSLDLLLIDDIQFLSGKSKTQEELFYIYEGLIGAGKQIILAGDIPLNKIPGVESRLISRLVGGLTVAVESPDIQTRVSILLCKSNSYKTTVDEEVAFFIAKNVRSNIRALEGALVRVNAYAKFHNLPITVGLTKEALKDIISMEEGNAREKSSLNSDVVHIGDSFSDISKLVVGAVDCIKTSKYKSGATSGIATRFPSLDHYTSGLQRGDLIVVAGRPCMGERDFVRNIAMHVALDNKLPVAIVENETGGIVLATNMIASIAKIDRHSLRNGKVEDVESDRIAVAANILCKAPIHYSSLTPVSEQELGEQLRGLNQRVGGLGLVMVDCFPELKLCGEQMNDYDVNKVARISRYLKYLAKELNVPVIVLSPVNQVIEDRCNKWPTLTDLPGMGAIANAADLVLMIYRDEVYEPESEEKGTAQIIVQKNLNGPIGVISLQYDGRYGNFEEQILGQSA
jgi:replicative DNA helicase